MKKDLNDQQVRRERATYRYLTALDHGDIDALIEVLEQSAHDADLEHMVLEAHQAYFHEQATSLQTIEDTETQEIEEIKIVPLPPRNLREKPRHRPLSRWLQTLAAILIIMALLSSFLTIFMHNRGGMAGTASPTASTNLTCNWTQYGNTYPGALNAIAAVSSDDIWAVGNEQSAPGASTIIINALIEHWNGTEWSVVPNPLTSSQDTSSFLNDIQVSSPNNIWAVGYIRPTNLSHDLSIDEQLKTLTEHWDGSKWSVIPSPDGPMGNGLLTSLHINSSNDIWAVGSFIGTDKRLHPLFEHWDGENWYVGEFQDATGTVLEWDSDQSQWSNAYIGAVNKITGSSAHDTWIAGLALNDSGVGTHSVIAHGDGSRFTWLPPLTDINTINDIGEVSPTSVWAVGNTTDGSLLEYWDGQQWNNMPLPESTDIINKLNVISANDVWAIGEQRNGVSSISSTPLLLHWNGKNWQRSSIDPSQTSVSALNGLVVLSSEMWAIGTSPVGTEGDRQLNIIGKKICP